MMRFNWRSLVVSSMMVGALAAHAVTFPRSWRHSCRWPMRGGEASLKIRLKWFLRTLFQQVRRSPIRSLGVA